MEHDAFVDKADTDYLEVNRLYDECLTYLETVKAAYAQTFNTNINRKLFETDEDDDYDEIDSPGYETDQRKNDFTNKRSESFVYEVPKADFKVENEIIKPHESKTQSTDEVSKTDNDLSNLTKKQNLDIKPQKDAIKSVSNEEIRSERLRKFSQQLPKIIITQSNTSLSKRKEEVDNLRKRHQARPPIDKRKRNPNLGSRPSVRYKAGYGDYPKRLVSKSGLENVALISNVPSENIRMLNDTFHTLINIRWRWIVWGTVFVHFAIWLVFAGFWYIAALAHYDFEPDPPRKTCITGGNDFTTIFLASVEAQTTIGFGDRTIDEECPESIFLFIMQLILGTGLSGVLTSVVYAKLTRPEKLSRDGVGFSKNAVISMRDGKLCLMIRAWDLNYDHIIGSDFSAHFVKTYRTKEGEVIRYFAQSLVLQQRQFLLWPVTIVHVIDEDSPLYSMTPDDFASFSYEITISLKGASASMGTFTQSQTSYLPAEVRWGCRFPPVVRFDRRKQKYVIDHKKLNQIEEAPTPLCSASQMFSSSEKSDANPERPPTPSRPPTPGSFTDQVSMFHLQRSSSFRNNEIKS
ncbi:ATP-sensitive inward rectifier potassium channel 1 [Plutella xylostella]|uniref:ATP-sensitive inward rectifier potassium channel 1 n=1 Tax=Plutella xylostella TaxID=51655 RepID=UPI002032A1E5|nr:ATP-sensitive inward rectifier potassium channel 1 [Plutella xylostella]